MARFTFFSGDNWLKDPRLDPFREAVWQLPRDGRMVGHLISSVGPMRSFPALWVKRESMWFGIVWSDGEHERYLGDYGPRWYTVAELEQGFYEDEERGRLDARPLAGVERDALWDRYKDTL